MEEVVQGPQAKRKRPRDKAWWVCLIAALSFCLWGTNVLPLQQVEFQVTTNVAISQHRMPMLQRLAHDLNEGVLGRTTAFSSLEIQPDETIPSSSSNSDLRSVRIKIRCSTHRDIPSVEKSLNELTTPCMESAECLVFEKQLRLERWLLESCAHSMKRLELDLDREKNAIEIDKIASDDVEEPVSTSPFRLTSFGTRASGQQPSSELVDKLRQLNQARNENVESMVLTLERMKAKAIGFLSLTGSPRMEPVVRPITTFRLLVLCVLCTSVWLLLMGWLRPIRGYKLPWRKSFKLDRDASDANNAAPVTETSSSGIKKTIHWMQREGIPYLGAIQVLSDENASRGTSWQVRTQQLSRTVAPKTPTWNAGVSTQREWAIQLNPIKLLKSLGEGSLVLWIGLFAAKLMFDPVWRELAFVAPLAAISRMISGIQ